MPFPKEVELKAGTFTLDGELTLEAPATSAQLLGSSINDELERAGLAKATIENIGGDLFVLRLSATAGRAAAEIGLPRKVTPEDYVLEVMAGGVLCASPREAGLFYAVQTLRQLIRANRQGRALPCLKIRDWPSLAWRGFCADITRGPSPTLDTLKKEVDLGAGLKMNLFHYYIEHQFAFKKHPLIGPKDGSLTADELKALVRICQAAAYGDSWAASSPLGTWATVLAARAIRGLGRE